VPYTLSPASVARLLTFSVERFEPPVTDRVERLVVSAFRLTVLVVPYTLSPASVARLLTLRVDRFERPVTIMDVKLDTEATLRVVELINGIISESKLNTAVVALDVNPAETIFVV
jgi:hypothetical protein